MSPCCGSILGVVLEGVKGNQVPLEWTETFGSLLKLWHDPWSSSRLSCGERLLFRCNGNAGNPFLMNQGMEPFPQAEKGEMGLLMSLARPSVFLSSGDGYFGQLLELLQRCEGPFRGSREKV